MLGHVDDKRDSIASVDFLMVPHNIRIMGDFGVSCILLTRVALCLLPPMLTIRCLILLLSLKKTRCRLDISTKVFGGQIKGLDMLVQENRKEKCTVSDD